MIISVNAWYPNERAIHRQPATSTAHLPRLRGGRLATLGHGRWSRFARMPLPGAASGIRAGLLLAWLRAFGEFGAAVGDAYTAQRSLDRATELLHRSNPEEEPAFIYWFNRTEVEGNAGTVGLQLGRFTDAEEHLRSAVALVGPDFSRTRALFTCDLAKARLGIGAVEHACATASDAAVTIRRLNSKRDQNRLAEFRQALTPYANTKAAREFDDKHGDLIAAVTV
jgi:tetratricopeptide (TPR) repeat protein